MEPLPLSLSPVPVNKKGLENDNSSCDTEGVPLQKLPSSTDSRLANRLTNLLSQLQDGLLLEDENRKIVLVNRHFCDLFAIPITPDELMGIDCSGMADQSKHYFRNPGLFVNRVNQLLEHRQTVLGEELELVDGRTFERDYIPLFEGSEYVGHLWKYSDITRRKWSENAALRQKEKYQRIIENMNLGLIEVDLEERIVYTNQNFSAMSGYQPDELIGQKATEILLRGQNADLMKHKNESRLRGILDAYEIAIKSKRGEAMWWLISGAPLYSNTGEVIGSTGIHLDITKQKQLESELRIAKQEAEASAKAKELFLANMSHEIRTPMNAVLSFGKQLLKTSLTNQQRFMLDMINTAAGNLLVILNDILDFSKIEAGQLSLEKIGFSLTKLLLDAVHVMSNQAEEKGLLLTAQVDDGMADVVLGDPYRLNQILINLLSNAIKFTEQGSVTLTCQSHRIGGLQSVSIGIVDTGIGIKPEFIEKIFNKFTQEDGSIGRRYGGTGLGMSITKQLVDLMGGAIQIKSTANVGTVIQLSLCFPIGSHRDIITTEPKTATVGELKGKRILLVEDNEMNRLVARTILVPIHVALTEVTNGLQAVEALRSESFDLILMDVQMPVMDGLEATRLIRNEISKSIPIIALTASALRSEKEECYQVGMTDFLAKPFEEYDLIHQLTKWLCPTETIAESSKPLYDLSRLERISLGNPDFIRQMIRLFCSETPFAAVQMRTALEEGDLKKVKFMAHRLKSSVNNLGLQRQLDIIQKIESLVVQDSPSAELKTLIQEFEISIQKVIKQLQETSI